MVMPSVPHGCRWGASGLCRGAHRGNCLSKAPFRGIEYAKVRGAWSLLLRWPGGPAEDFRSITIFSDSLSDNGPEFLGEAFTTWRADHGILIDYIEPGKPNQNAYIERFNRTYRTEVLDTWLFRDLDEVREMTWAWMFEYNEKRDHDSLGGMTPIEALENATSSTFELPT
jgi:transposase InsO family protein